MSFETADFRGKVGAGSECIPSRLGCCMYPADGCCLSTVIGVSANTCAPCIRQVVIDRETGRSKGYGFVKFDDSRDAEDAINGSHGKVG